MPRFSRHVRRLMRNHDYSMGITVHKNGRWSVTWVQYLPIKKT